MTARRHLLRDLASSGLPEDEAFISSSEHDQALRDKDAEIAHWKANHADMVKRQKLLIDRPDMPLVRVKAYELVTETMEENARIKAYVTLPMKARIALHSRLIAQLESKFHDTEILLRDILEFGDIGYGMAERIKQHIVLIKQEQKQ